MDIAVNKVVDFIDRVRAFDVREGVTDPDSGSNGIDDGMTDTLTESSPEDSTEQELRSFVAGLNVDEQAALVALLWIGRGDYEPEEWASAMRAARERRESSTGTYLLGVPNVGDLLDEGLSLMTQEEDLPLARDDAAFTRAPSGAHPELSEQDLFPSDEGEGTDTDGR